MVKVVKVKMVKIDFKERELIFTNTNLSNLTNLSVRSYS